MPRVDKWEKPWYTQTAMDCTEAPRSHSGRHADQRVGRTGLEIGAPTASVADRRDRVHGKPPAQHAISRLPSRRPAPLDTTLAAPPYAIFFVTPAKGSV